MAEGLNIIASEGTTVRVSEDGGGIWRELPGIQSHVEGGGDLNQRQVKAFKGVATRLGLPDVSSITVSALYTPTHPAWLMVNKAARDGKLLSWEVYTEREEIWEEDLTAELTLAIAAPAAPAGLTDPATMALVTFAGSDAATKRPNLNSGDFGDGMTLEVIAQAAATKSFTIEHIDEDNQRMYLESGTINAMTGAIYYSSAGIRAAEDGAVAAINAGKAFIRTPEEYLRYTAKVGKPPAALENEGDMQTSFTVYPQTLLGDWLVRAG